VRSRASSVHVVLLVADYPDQKLVTFDAGEKDQARIAELLRAQRSHSRPSDSAMPPAAAHRG